MAWKQHSNITLHGDRIGSIEVCYLQERAEVDEGPFLQEERSLINEVAECLSGIIRRRQTEKELRCSEEVRYEDENSC